MVYAIVLRRTFPVILLSLAAAGCDAGVAHLAAPADLSRLFCDVTLGVCFDVPETWQGDVDGTALTFAGPSGTDDFYTVLSLQGTPDPGLPLDLILDTTYAAFATGRRFQWFAREPHFVAGRPALAYGLELDLDESARRRIGLLIAGDGMLVDLAYSAIPSFFWRNLPTFLRAEDSLTIAGGSPSPPP
jgi:hypothetical protein